MADSCYTPGDFDRLLGMLTAHPEGHQDLRHLDDCTRCRAELEFYRSFLDRDRVPAGADPVDARKRLNAFLEHEFGGVESSSAPAPGPARRRPRELRRWSPVLVAACLVCAVLFANHRQDIGPDLPSGTVRNLVDASGTLDIKATARADGVVLHWTGPAEADAYRIVILDSTMAEIARFDGGLSGEFRIGPTDRARLQGPGPFLWYVAAVLDGDEIVRSAVQAFEFPK
jgi:hypothetical protein